MKKILGLLISAFALLSANAQVNYYSNKIFNESASALGEKNISAGSGSFVTGFNSAVHGDYSFSSGHDNNVKGKGSYALGALNTTTGATSGAIGVYNSATGTGSIAMGYKTTASGSFSYVIGKGMPNSPLVNNISSSFMIGINSDIPTFFVGGASGPGTLGRIGIGTTNPGSRLQLNGNLAIGYSGQTMAPENGLCIAGKVGIGTSTPGSQLQITDNMSIGYNAQTTAPVNGLCISGKVGIGVSNPAEKLHIDGSVKLNSIKLPDGTEIASKADLGKWEDCNSGIKYAAGNICIGNSEPNRPLTIDGTGNDNQLLTFRDLNGTDKWHINLKSGGINFAETGLADHSLFIEEGGNIGIGTGNPMGKLQIGNGYSNVSMGPAPGAAIGHGASYIGFNAIRNPQTGIWQCYSNGSHNGGVVIYSSVYGGINFSLLQQTGGSNKTYTDQDIKDKVKMRLSSSGIMKVKEVEVIAAIWPDHVFDKAYELSPLNEVKSYIEDNKHLPGIPSEKEVKANGLNLGEMDALLLKKIEELVLYTIEQQEQLQLQQKLIENLQNQVNELKN